MNLPHYGFTRHATGETFNNYGIYIYIYIVMTQVVYDGMRRSQACHSMREDLPHIVLIATLLEWSTYKKKE